MEPTETSDAGFLKSLSPGVPSFRRHRDAQVYLLNFKKNREALTKKLFKIYNEKVFDSEVQYESNEISFSPVSLP